VIRIATDLHLSPEMARKFAETFTEMGASDDFNEEEREAFADLGRAIAEATPVTYAAALAFEGDALKTDVLRAKGAESFVALDGKARELGIAWRCVRAEVALLYVDDADEGALAGDVTETIMPSAEGGAA
jgi:hypothetical protein